MPHGGAPRVVPATPQEGYRGTVVAPCAAAQSAADDEVATYSAIPTVVLH